MITATVLTKNSEGTIKRTLDSLTSFAEVLLLDSGSTDATLAIAQTYPNVQIHRGPFLGFGPMHNYGAKLANYDWIFSVDSDEVVSPELEAEIRSLPLNPNHVYRMERHNYFNNKRIKGCSGWYPDWVVRLYNRKSTSFSHDLVHEKVLTQNLRVVSLSSPLLHTPYREVGDFLTKMQRYSTLYAEQKDPKNASLSQALFHGFFAFFKSYVFKQGFLAGKEGLILSLYMGHTAYYKYLKLLEKKERLKS